MHGFAKDGRCVVVKESILGKEWSWVGRISEGNCELRSSFNVVHGSRHEVSVSVKRDDYIGIGGVVELSVEHERRDGKSTFPTGHASRDESTPTADYAPYHPKEQSTFDVLVPKFH